MLYLVLFLVSFSIVFFSIPPIIRVAYQKRLFDAPLETRKIHKRIIPNFGGIAVFTAFLFSSSLFIPATMLPEANVLMAGGLIMFMTGLKDDIVGVSPAIKFVAQFTAAFIVAMLANLRIENLHGIFGIGELNYISSVLLTVFFVVGLVNAFNLIDGIDGLAGTLGLILSFSYAYIFFKSGDAGFSYMAIALAGALIGFLFFNVTPAKIFMGDSGSLILGFLAAVFSIRFMAFEGDHGVMLGSFMIKNHMGIVFAIIIVPLFDTLRVFTLRIIKNKSPFTADSNHLHHRLLFLGLSHIQATFVLAFITMLAVVMALSLHEMHVGQVIGMIFLTMLIINGILSIYIEQYKKSFFSLSEKGVTARGDDGGNVGDRAVHKEVINKIFRN